MRLCVSRSELLEQGFTRDEILSFGGPVDLDSFVPCSKVWPVGFAWASCVAQPTLLSICEEPGLRDRRDFACGSPLPGSFDRALLLLQMTL